MRHRLYNRRRSFVAALIGSALVSITISAIVWALS
jgi:hypothetical protein